MSGEKVKKSIFKKWWFWVIVVIVVIAAASGGGDDTQPTATNQSPTDSSPEEELSDEVFKVGDTVQLKDNKLTVNGVEKSKGSEFDKPKDGMEYIIVTVTIENAGKSNISYNPFDFKMSNSQGQITDMTFTTINNSNSLQSGELAPGGKVSGTIAFEQPIDDNKLQLQYQPSFWSDKTIKIDLQ